MVMRLCALRCCDGSGERQYRYQYHHHLFDSSKQAVYWRILLVLGFEIVIISVCILAGKAGF